MAGPARSTARIELAMVAMLVFLAGLLVGRWTATDEQSATREWPDEKTASALDALREEFARAHSSERVVLTEPAPARVAATETAEAERFEAVAAKLERLIRELERASPLSGPRRPPNPGRASLAEVRADLALRGSSGEALDALGDELTRAHLLWSLSDLVERYGPPRRIDTPGMGWLSVFYAFDGDERQYPKPSVRFSISQGYVTRVGIEDP